MRRIFWWIVVLWMPMAATAMMAHESGGIVFNKDEISLMSTRVKDLQDEITRLNEKIVRLKNKVNDSCI